jgi:hypothetical protein
MLMISGSCWMRLHGDMKAKRYISDSKLHNAGSVGETKSFKDNALTLDTFPN